MPTPTSKCKPKQLVQATMHTGVARIVCIYELCAYAAERTGDFMCPPPCCCRYEDQRIRFNILVPGRVYSDGFPHRMGDLGHEYVHSLTLAWLV